MASSVKPLNATAREVWQAAARTYDVDMSGVARRRFIDFEFDEGAPLLEQLARVETLAADMQPPVRDDALAYELCDKLPEDVAMAVTMRSYGNISMSMVWDVARIKEASRIRREDELQGEGGDDRGSRGPATLTAQSRRRRGSAGTAAKPGHFDKSSTLTLGRC